MHTKKERKKTKHKATKMSKVCKKELKKKTTTTREIHSLDDMNPSNPGGGAEDTAWGTHFQAGMAGNPPVKCVCYELLRNKKDQIRFHQLLLNNWEEINK